jgi:hypothetical protein
MANATISGDNGVNAATLTNSTDAFGTPSQSSSNVTVQVSNATVASSGGTFYNVSFSGGNDALTATNMPWVNPPLFVDSVGFDQIVMGGGNDTVDLDRSGFLDTDMGGGDDVLRLTNSGGQTANMGTGNDFVRVDLTDASGFSEEELAQKDGQPLLDLDGGADQDTLRLVGDWTVTLSSGNVTMDDGFNTTVTNVFTSADYGIVTGYPALLNGTVQWSDPMTLSGGEDVHLAVAFSNFETLEAVCFASGTRLETPSGMRDIKVLREGDMICTRSGPMPIRWIGKRRLDLIELMANPRLLPIRIPAGAFGDGIPNRDVLLSPQHRVLVRSGIAEEMFGASEVLVAAKQLVGFRGIEVDGDTREITYFHIMLDTHEVVFADGMEAETLLPGPQALKMLPTGAREELLSIFPDLLDDVDRALVKASLPIPKGRECRALVARMIEGYTRC